MIQTKMIQDETTSGAPSGEWNSKSDKITPSMTADEAARYCTAFAAAIKLMQHNYRNQGTFGMVNALSHAMGTFVNAVHGRMAQGLPLNDLDGAAGLHIKATCLAAAMFLMGDELIELANLGNTAVGTLIKSIESNPEVMKEGHARLIVRRAPDGQIELATVLDDNGEYQQKVKELQIDKALADTIEQKSQAIEVEVVPTPEVTEVVPAEPPVEAPVIKIKKPRKKRTPKEGS